MNLKTWKNLQTESGEWGIPIEIGRVGNWSYWVEWMRTENVWRVFRRDLPLDLLEDDLGVASSESKARDLLEIAMNQRRQELELLKGGESELR